MKLKNSRRLLAAAANVGVLAIAAAPSIANADVTWLVTGSFDDGGALSGYFNINVYGFLAGYDLKTTAGSTDAAFDYTPANSYYSNGTFYIDAQPQYQSDLHLTFANDLGIASPNNPIVGGSQGPSWECQGSYNCYLPANGAIRYITSGSASALVPEPAAWALMLAGLGGLGSALRLARRRTRLATA